LPATHQNEMFPETLDITAAIHYRMVPFEMRSRPSDFEPTDMLDRICRRLYPSVLEEARFCYRGTSRRGVAVFEEQRWHYAFEDAVHRLFNRMRDSVPDSIVRAIHTYDPRYEVIIFHFCDGCYSVVRAGEGSMLKWIECGREKSA